MVNNTGRAAAASEHIYIYIYIYILDSHMAPYCAFSEHSEEEQSSVDENSEFEM